MSSGWMSRQVIPTLNGFDVAHVHNYLHFGASAGGCRCIAPKQDGSAKAALWDQRDIVKSLCGSRTDADNGNQFGMTPLSVLFERGFLNIEWWHNDTSFNASCSCDGSWSLCNHRQVCCVSHLRLCRHAFPLQIFVYVPVDNKHCASYVFAFVNDQAEQFRRCSMKVATPSFNWIPLSSTLGHGVVVLASGQLPYLGYAPGHSFLASGHA